MTLINLTPSQKDLRWFGFIVGGIFGAIALYPILKGQPAQFASSGVSVALLAAAAIFPRVLEKPYSIWMKVGYILGAINSHIILSVLFFVLITPMGFVLRLVGHDPLHRRIRQNVDSYKLKKTPRAKNHFERMF